MMETYHSAHILKVSIDIKNQLIKKSFVSFYLLSLSHYKSYKLYDTEGGFKYTQRH